MLHQWENMWNKEQKYILNYNMKENFYKKTYLWYLTLDKLSKMYKGVSNICWKCNLFKGTFYQL